MDRVRQCPCCPVRFLYGTELDWHLRDEHPEAHADYVTRSQRAQATAAVIPGQRRPSSAAVPR